MNSQMKIKYTGRGLKRSQVRSFRLHRAGVSHPPGTWICSTWKLSEPCTQTFDILDILFLKGNFKAEKALIALSNSFDLCFVTNISKKNCCSLHIDTVEECIPKHLSIVSIHVASDKLIFIHALILGLTLKLILLLLIQILDHL